MAFCENCGAEVQQGDQFCESCGTKVGTTAPAQPAAPVASPTAASPQNSKSPILALILSLIICGIGQIYNGHWKKGIALLVVFIILYLIFVPLVLIPWIFGMYDAYTMAEKINKGENPKDLF